MEQSILFMKDSLRLFLLFSLGVYACSETPESFEEGGKGFINVAKKANLEYAGECYSACWGDFNSDGLMDIFTVNHYDPPPSLYINKGDGTFQDMASTSGIEKDGDFHGCAVGDYDNDGDQDIYVSVGTGRGLEVADKLLYQNDGTGRFVNVVVKAGVTNPKGRGRSVSWVDYDNDGFLDLFMANGKRSDAPSVLFRNNGDGTFSDVTVKAGLDFVDEPVEASWTDYDNDGYMDLTVSFNRGHRDTWEISIFRNMRDGTFKKVMTFNGLRYAWGDYDNDGDYDLFITAPPRMYIGKYDFSVFPYIFRGFDKLYENTGGGQFIDVSDKTGFRIEMGGNKAVFFDYDNDGDLDIYLLVDDPSGANLNDIIFENNGDKTFTNVVKKIGLIQDFNGKGCSVTNADYNNDGFLDLFLTNGRRIWDDKYEAKAGSNVLYENKGNMNHWLKLKLFGTTSNRDAIGAQIRLYAGNMMQYRQSTGGMEGYSQHSSIIHFGLAKSIVVDKIEIVWPSSKRSVLTNINADQIIEVKEND
ncbi:MAG: CRTAC1 family protein [Candidatus Omnitrophica bacterium]|nr:CRTAC1 family protein [Candidatus Omnitrophota bacterium]